LIVVGVRNHAKKPDGSSTAVLVPMTDSGWNKDTVARPDFDLTRIESNDHPPLENDLLMFYVVVSVARNPTLWLEGELAGDEVRDPALRAEQDLQ
jgi:hypothetical protein